MELTKHTHWYVFAHGHLVGNLWTLCQQVNHYDLYRFWLEGSKMLISHMVFGRGHFVGKTTTIIYIVVGWKVQKRV